MSKHPDHAAKSIVETSGGPMPQSQHHDAWWQRLENRIWTMPEEGSTPGRRIKYFFKRWLQILDRSFLGFIANKGPANASALTYTTILTIVPVLAILLAVLKGFGVHETARDALKGLPFVQEVRIDLGPKRLAPTAFASPAKVRPGPAPAVAKAPEEPDSASRSDGPSEVLTGSDIVDKIYDSVERTNIGKLGVIGVAGVLWAVFALLSKIERAMNDAWGVRRSRPWGRKLADYINMLVISLLLLAALSATVTGSIFAARHNLEILNEAQRFLLKVTPYLIVWAALMLMYFYIPNTHVRWRSAAISGLIAGTIFQVAQALFVGSQRLASRYQIYGAFAIVLFLLLWLYLSWCIVLWGAEVSSTHQNLRDWRRRRRAWHGTPFERETLALRMAALLSAPLLGAMEHGKRLDTGDLADLLRLPPGPVGEMIELFRSHGLVVQAADDGSYLFARSPENVSVLDILRLVRQGDLRPHPQAGGFMGDVTGQISPPLQSRTVKDLAHLPLDEIKTFNF